MRAALGVLVLACSCATVGGASSNAHQAIMAKAVFDLACSKHEIRLTRLPHERVLVDVATGMPVTRAAYEASGCGERADYVVDCTGTDGAQSCTAALTHDVSAAFPPSAR